MNLDDLVDVSAATQKRSIFWDKDLYQLELERIFARSWLFLTHESQIPEAGDFFVTKMGQDEVIVWRQQDGETAAFLNQCRHRGVRLCMAEAGNARALACGFHGWAYRSDGTLQSVPLEKECYGADFDKQDWGLRPVPRVASYRGFIFGCMDEAAPPLEEFLGDAVWYLDIWADVPGGIEFLGPPSRAILRANWKIPTENFIGDAYHIGWTHASIGKVAAGRNRSPQAYSSDDAGLQVTTRYGHGMGILYGRQSDLLFELSPELVDLLPPRDVDAVRVARGEKAAKLSTSHWNGSIFPNASYLIGINVFKVWHPIGPDKIEVMTWVIGEKRMSQEAKDRFQIAVHRAFGTAGMVESDDCDNFEYCGLPNEGFVTRQGVLNAKMALGRNRIDEEYPGVVGPYMSELAIRGFYRSYVDFLKASSWPDLAMSTRGWKEAMCAA